MGTTKMMKTNMTKEEKIKEVCGDYYDAYLKKRDPIAFMEMESLGILDKIYEITHNNGWIKIESEDDLPKEDGKYWCFDKNNDMEIWYFSPKSYLDKKEYLEFVTHYQPIVEPKPPIY